jgi:hypothetical protein
MAPRARIVRPSIDRSQMPPRMTFSCSNVKRAEMWSWLQRLVASQPARTSRAASFMDLH